MHAPTKTAIAMLGGATALVVTVGAGGPGGSPVGDPSAPPTHRSSSVVAPQADNGAAHIATLSGCVAGANC